MSDNTFTLEGHVRLDETSYDKLVNFHFENGFCILTAFRNGYSLKENRERNRRLMSDLNRAEIGYIKITGGYKEIVEPDDERFDDAEEIPGSPDKRRVPVIEESLLVPNYDRESGEPYEDFNDLKNLILEMGKVYEQDSVLIAPPKKDGGGAYYVVTNPRAGDVGTTDMQFTGYSLASITDAYFSSLAKTAGKLKAKFKDGDGGFKFESREFFGSFVQEPCHTVTGASVCGMKGMLAPFGSHLYENSSLFEGRPCMEVNAGQVKQLQKAVYGKDDFVHTWGILTAENPMGKKSTGTINRDLMSSLKKDLRVRGLEYIPVKGKYGNDENSLFVLNVRIDELKDMSMKYDQAAFIFAECKDGKCDMFYYEKGEGKDAEYKVFSQRRNVVDMSTADDFFTSIKPRSKRAFKFQIPFFDDTAESLLHPMNAYIFERYGYQGEDRLRSLIERSCSPKTPVRLVHSARFEAFETKQDRIRRLMSLRSAMERREDALMSEEVRDEIWEIDQMLSKLIHVPHRVIYR